MTTTTNTTYTADGIITLESLNGKTAQVVRRTGDRVVRTIPLPMAAAKRIYRALTR